MIRFFDLKRQDKNRIKEILNNVKKIFFSTDFILGKNVYIFERKFAKICNSKYGISCANGTDAITIALKSLNLKKNSEVILPAMTYCSTLIAVLNANLKPVLVDISSNSSEIDITKVKKKINNKTKVILPVHLYGSPVNLYLLKKIIKNKKIYLIDDCAQAHGGNDFSSGKKKNIGSIADISCFSFYPGKNLGAYGDGGMITTNNKNLHDKISAIRNLGSVVKYRHKYLGFNSRLDTIQATILLSKIKDLNRNNNLRKKIANIYNNNIINPKVVKIKYSKGSVYHQYIIMTNLRKKLIKLFNNNKVQYGFHYPYPLHKLEFAKKYFKNQSFPNSEKLANNGISLPIDPFLNNKELNKICKIINSL